VLVDRVHHWPGVNGLGALLAGRCLRATPGSPSYGASGCGVQLRTVTLNPGDAS
jgi:hypothetical protein